MIINRRSPVLKQSSKEEYKIPKMRKALKEDLIAEFIADVIVLVVVELIVVHFFGFEGWNDPLFLLPIYAMIIFFGSGILRGISRG